MPRENVLDVLARGNCYFLCVTVRCAKNVSLDHGYIPIYPIGAGTVVGQYQIFFGDSVLGVDIGARDLMFRSKACNSALQVVS